MTHMPSQVLAGALQELPGNCALQAAALRHALPVLEAMPFPIMWIRHDFHVMWANQAARSRTANQNMPLCHVLCHGYSSPCSDHGSPCPKKGAELHGKAVTATHFSRHGRKLECAQIVAVPLEDGGVLELHIPDSEELTRDPLTGLLNRLALDRLARSILKSKSDAPWRHAVVLLGIDRLTSMSLHYGSAAQGQALARIGNSIQLHLRGSDPAGCWIADEILIVLPCIDPLLAETRVHLIIKAIAELEILAAPDGSRLTASAGLKILQGHGDPFEAVVDQAQFLMFQARASGGGRLAAG